jgi:hypothetical protein
MPDAIVDLDTGNELSQFQLNIAESRPCGQIYCILSLFNQKSMKIPKGWPEAINRGRTDHTMAKEKEQRTNNDL